MKKLAIITSHPIQYNAPLFKLLTERAKVKIMVFYTWGEAVLKDKYDPGFGKNIEWDIPLLEGYAYRFVENKSGDPGSHHFRGIDNPNLNQEVSDWNPDALLVYGWSFKSHLRLLRYFHKKIPIYFRGDSTLLDEHKRFNFKKLLREKLLRWVYKHIDYAFFVGTNNKAYYLKMGLSESQLIFAPHTIDNSRFSVPTSETKFRESLGIPENDIVFLYAGKFKTEKGVLQLLNAFLKANTQQAHLVLAGNGVLKIELLENAKEHSAIHFLDFQNQSQMPALYQMADIFVLASLQNETWGLAINEAMAAGCAILASDKCGCATDLVKESVNGFIFESGNEMDLIEKIRVLNQSKSKLRTLGKSSQKIIEPWNFSVVAETIESFI